MNLFKEEFGKKVEDIVRQMSENLDNKIFNQNNQINDKFAKTSKQIQKSNEDFEKFKRQYNEFKKRTFGDLEKLVSSLIEKQETDKMELEAQQDSFKEYTQSCI